MFSNVPAADVQPPDGISKVNLQAVHFVMDVLEPKPRPSMKRSKTSPTNTCTESSQHVPNSEWNIVSDAMSQELTLRPEGARREARLDSDSPTTSPACKRKRSRPEVPVRTSSSPTSCSSHGVNLRRSPPASNIIQPHAKVDLDVEELAEVRLMVDGAMRLAIHGLSKSCNGLKVKANTFRSGLANTAPCLWRPGYLAVRRRRSL
jgi:hypothetical protein